MNRILSFCLLCVCAFTSVAQPRFGTMPQGAPPVPATRPAYVPPPIVAPSLGSNGWSSPTPVAAPMQNWMPPQNGVPQVAGPVFGGQGNNLLQAQQMVACHSGGYQPSIPLCQAQDARVFGDGGVAPALQAPTTWTSPQQFPAQPELVAPQIQGTQNTAPNLRPPIQVIPQSIKQPVVVAPSQNTIYPQSVPQTLAAPSLQNRHRSSTQVQSGRNPYLIAQPKQSQTTTNTQQSEKPATYIVSIPLYSKKETGWGIYYEYTGDEKRIASTPSQRDEFKNLARGIHDAASKINSEFTSRVNVIGEVISIAESVPRYGSGITLGTAIVGEDAEGRKLSNAERVVRAGSSLIPGGAGTTKKAVNYLKPLGLGSTGRTVENNLAEAMAMQYIKDNPGLGEKIIDSIDDYRWNGWAKMQYRFKTENGRDIIIHYVAKYEDGVLKAIDDFKFK